jgi:hypothetical protein
VSKFLPPDSEGSRNYSRQPVKRFTKIRALIIKSSVKEAEATLDPVIERKVDLPQILKKD